MLPPLILIPLDGSPLAENILPHVIQLGLPLHARLVLLRVIEYTFQQDRSWRTNPAAEEDPLRMATEEAETYLNGIRAGLEEKGFNSIRARVEYGPVVNTVCAVARHEQAALVALASHGRTGLERVFYGSVAAGLLQQIDRPLLLIRAHE